MDKLEALMHFVAMGLGVKPAYTRALDGGTKGFMKQIVIQLLSVILLGVVSGVGSAWYMLQNDTNQLAQQAVHNADYQAAVNALPGQAVLNQRILDELASMAQELKRQEHEIRMIADRRN